MPGNLVTDYLIKKMFNIKNITANVTVDENFPYEEFIRIPEVPCQRNTEERLKSAKHLKKLRPEHGVVHLARLTKDSNIKGKFYPKGMVFRVDSNTRAMTWETENRITFLKNLLLLLTTTKPLMTSRTATTVSILLKQVSVINRNCMVS